MYMNKFLIFGLISAIISGCGTNKSGLWHGQDYNTNAVTNPSDIQDAYLYSTSLYGSDDGGRAADIAVLLPFSGNAKNAGNDIKTSIETAFLRKPKSNVKISFYDLSGDTSHKREVINHALNTKPDVITGPLFAEDAKTIRDLKSSSTPVISFTSDVSALGNGVITTNLIPTQSIETIVQQIKQDGAKSMIILAPNDKSGKLMVSVADRAGDIYDIDVNGIFYYESGKPESIKDTAMNAAMYKTRNAANTRAREILSDILTNEKLNSSEYSNLENQLEKLSRNETLGKLPYDAVLFLGSGEDSKTLASFLRYYGIGNRDVSFYGTTLWHASDITSDFTMSGAKYATLPDISDNFVSLYSMVSGHEPDYLASFGYDGINLALGMLFTQKSESAYLFDPSGYIGTTGAFRIQPSGESERALRIMELNGSDTANTIKPAPVNFLVPLYNVRANNVKSVSARELSTRGVNPGDYISIPERFMNQSKYKTKTIGANYVPKESEIIDTPIQVFAPSEPEIVQNPEFEPVKLESVSRKNIDSVEISE